MDQPSAPCAQIELLCGTSEPLDCRNEVQWILLRSRNITEAFLPHLPSPTSHFLQPFSPKALLCQSWLCWVMGGEWLPSSGLTPGLARESTCHGQTTRSSPALCSSGPS